MPLLTFLVSEISVFHQFSSVGHSGVEGGATASPLPPPSMDPPLTNRHPRHGSMALYFGITVDYTCMASVILATFLLWEMIINCGFQFTMP